VLGKSTIHIVYEETYVELFFMQELGCVPVKCFLLRKLLKSLEKDTVSTLEQLRILGVPN
jgi:hypothetical protein